MNTTKQIQQQLIAALSAGTMAVRPWSVVPGPMRYMIERVMREAGMVQDGCGCWMSTARTIEWIEKQDTQNG